MPQLQHTNGVITERKCSSQPESCDGPQDTRRGSVGVSDDRRKQRGKGEDVKKREIITTELVAGADFFHHLPWSMERTMGLRESVLQ